MANRNYGTNDAARFGSRLRELRRHAGLSLRGLAARTFVDFTYISKLENGQLPPPSEAVVSRLALTLGADGDELCRLSGRVPADIAGVLKSRARREFGLKIKEYRRKAGLTQQQLAAGAGIDATYLSKIENGVMPPPTRAVIIRLAEALKKNKSELITIAGKTPVNITRMRKQLNTGEKRRFFMPRISMVPVSVLRAFLVLLLVAAFSTTLWFASPAPVKAVDISVTNPAAGTLRNSYSFTVRVDINDDDLLPVQSVDLRIYKAVDTGIYTVLFTDLPLPSAPDTTESRSYSGAGGSASITGTTGPVWGEAQDTRYGYGYGYQSGTWGTLNFGSGYGYGYSSGGDYTGVAYITYSVVWVPPAGWPASTYRIQAIVYGTDGDDSQAFTNDDVAQFTLVAPTAPPPAGQPDVTPVLVDDDHKFIEDVTIQSDDNLLTLEIAAGAVGETATGGPLTSISVTRIADPPDLPVDTNRVALVYDLEPDGAQFPGGITLTMTYDPAAIEGGTLVMAYWDGSAWIDLEGPFTINEAAHTISTTIYHFTMFTAIENVSPAAFVATGLAISPDELEIGQEAVIVFTLTNTGDLSGAYELVLEVNGTAEETLTANLDGHESIEVTFTLSWDTAGTYTISVAGLSGTVTVNALPATPTSTPTFTPTATPTSTPTPTLTPTPTPTPTLGEPDEGGLAWWVLVLIGAAVVIVSSVILIIMRRRRA